MSVTPRRTSTGRRLLAVALLMTTAAVGIGSANGASAQGAQHHSLPAPLATPREAATIEGFAPDQSQFLCRHNVEPGVKAFEKRVLAHYRVSHSDGDMRGCDVGGTSEHKDGRAWDWGVDHRIPKQRAAGKSMLKWLFATDSHGNQDAMFRRLGLMYVIWNKQIWGAWSQQWEPYSCHGVTLCHVDHMHFSFGWAGAEKKTSYWTHKVSPVIEPPLPILGLLNAHRILHLAAATGESTARWLLKGGATYRITASGVWHHAKGRNGLSDAMCMKTKNGWVRSPDGVSIGGDQLQGWGAQWVPAHDNGNGCDTKSHTYRMVLDQLLPSTVRVELPDNSRSDDAGRLTVNFERIG